MPVSVTVWLPLLVKLARPAVVNVSPALLEEIVAVTLPAPTSTSATERPEIARLVWENAVPIEASLGTVAVGASSTEVTLMVWLEPALRWFAAWPSSAVKVTVRARVDGFSLLSA